MNKNKTVKNMAFKNKFEMRTTSFGSESFLKLFLPLFALRTLIIGGKFNKTYKASKKINDFLFLSLEGSKLAVKLKKKFPSMKSEEIKLVIFLKMFHHEPLIDLVKTNFFELEKIFSDDVLNKRIAFPWVYERHLYDQYYKKFTDGVDELKNDEVDRLLEGTLQGVFQFSNLVVGPFGFFMSMSNRFILPTRKVNLWHCSDPACGALHNVNLKYDDTKVMDAYWYIYKECESKFGKSSEWVDFFIAVCKETNYYDHNHTGKFPHFFINSFSEKETKIVLKEMLKKHQKKIIDEKINNDLRRSLVGSPEKVVEKFNLAEIFQIVLTFSEEIIIDALETVIESGEICVPPTEIRHSMPKPYDDGWLDVLWQCSKLGVRSIGMYRNVSISRLKHMIKEIYSADTSKLEWKLRNTSGLTVNEKIDNYLFTENPQKIVTELIFCDPDYLKKCFELLKYGHFAIINSAAADQFLKNKVLWKLGFEIYSYPEYQKQFEERLVKLTDVVSREPRTEADREEIRGIAANFFVSLEEVLGNGLAFMTWALLSDHFVVTKFKFNLSEARRFMASKLSGIKIKSQELVFDKDGKNTLYPLICGYSLLAGLCESFISTSQNFKRKDEEMPGFYEQSSIQLFPFNHKMLILDLSPNDVSNVLKKLKEITISLEKLMVANIRNRIEHKRLDFPNSAEIRKMCDGLKEVYIEMSTEGMCPVVYMFNARQKDEFGRMYSRFTNFKGSFLEIKQPTEYELCHLPKLDKPLILTSLLHVGDSIQVMRFEFEEDSDFSEMWRNYPRKKPRLPMPLISV